MAEDILPDRPAERRRRRRLCAIRAMDRPGLLGEENLIPTLARRPELRWLADEEGARWTVLGQLGLIGDPGAFEEAVAWALETRRRHSGAGGGRSSRGPEEIPTTSKKPLTRGGEVRPCPTSTGSSGSL